MSADAPLDARARRHALVASIQTRDFATDDESVGWMRLRAIDDGTAATLLVSEQLDALREVGLEYARRMAKVVEVLEGIRADLDARDRDGSST